MFRPMFFHTLIMMMEAIALPEGAEPLEAGQADGSEDVVEQAELGLVESEPDQGDEDEGTADRQVEEGPVGVDAADAAID